jgi:phosphatidylinositol alpha-1,6-mannosyltransferase
MKSKVQSNVVGIHSQLPDILVVSRVFPPDPGGIQEYCYNRCLQDPNRVVVLSAACSGDKTFDKAQPFHIHRWPVPPLAYQHLGFVGSLLKQIVYLITSFISGVWLYRRYRYRYIEWMHGYDFPVVLFLSYILPIQFFFYLHGDEIFCALSNPIINKLFAWTLARSEGIVCNSYFTKNLLQSYYQISRPIHVIHPGVRPEKFGSSKILDKISLIRGQVRREYNIPEQAIVLLTVGRLVRNKGFDRVIKSLPILLAEGVDVYYLVCGQGPMETDLRSLAYSLEIAERIIFAGSAFGTRLASYYAACDVFVMLSFFDDKSKSLLFGRPTGQPHLESFGIVYLEAGYFSKPVIGSRVGGVEEAIHHGETGLLVDSQSSSEAIQALLQLCQDKDLREQLGLRGQEVAKRANHHRSLYFNQPQVEIPIDSNVLSSN